MLEVDHVDAFYGPSQALFGLSLAVGEGQTVALVGRNGAGKSTTLRAILGLARVRSGRVVWNGTEITAAPVHHRARAGIAWVPEDRRIFGHQTVAENLAIAARPGVAGGPWTAARVYTLFPDLCALRDRRGALLSGGQQQMLSIGRSLLLNPRLLLLDEPSEGLAPAVVAGLAAQLRLLKEQGVAMLLAEQNPRLVLEHSDYLHVLEKGSIRYSGTPAEARAAGGAVERFLTL